MEFIFAIIIFAAAFFLFSIGVIFTKKSIQAGSCGSKLIVDGEKMSCGVCASKEAQVCPTGDQEGFATLAQLGNPKRKKQVKDLPFSHN